MNWIKDCLRVSNEPIFLKSEKDELKINHFGVRVIYDADIKTNKYVYFRVFKNYYYKEWEIKNPSPEGGEKIFSHKLGGNNIKPPKVELPMWGEEIGVKIPDVSCYDHIETDIYLPRSGEVELIHKREWNNWKAYRITLSIYDIKLTKIYKSYGLTSYKIEYKTKLKWEPLE